MNLLHALALSIGVIGGIVSWAILGPLGGTAIQLWAIFIGWGAYYHSGGTLEAVKKNTPTVVLGCVISWTVLVGTVNLGGSLGVPGAAGVCVAVGAAVAVLAAKIPMFSTIPVTFYGFACVASYALQSDKLGSLFAASLADNPAINIIVSLLIGTIVGYVSETAGGTLAKSEEAPAEAQ